MSEVIVIKRGRYYDISSLFQLCDGDIQFLREMIDLFLKQVEEFISGLNSAIARCDCQQVYNHTHRFKSSLKAIGLNYLFKDFETLIILAKRGAGMEEIDVKAQEIKVAVLNSKDELIQNFYSGH